MQSQKTTAAIEESEPIVKLKSKLQELVVLDGELWTLPKDRTVYEQQFPGKVLFRVANRDAIEKRIRDERRDMQHQLEKERASLLGDATMANALEDEQEVRSGGILGETVTRPFVGNSK
ncbi:hypothetical protein BDF19DRAFT_451515 [Syncephalis fuscata]|nr:hypothetical protein BDF19DRAFT_451515 [Syncephalis fuscata]